MVRPIKVHGHSDSYQMNRVQGGFCGIDSCDLKEVGRFDVIVVC